MESKPTNQDVFPARHDSIGARSSTPPLHRSESRLSTFSPDMDALNPRYYQDNPIPEPTTPSRPSSVSGNEQKKSNPVVSALTKVLEICCYPFVACVGVPYIFGYMLYRENRYGDMGEVYMNGSGKKERMKEERKRQKAEEKKEKQRMKAEKQKEQKRKNDL